MGFLSMLRATDEEKPEGKEDFIQEESLFISSGESGAIRMTRETAMAIPAFSACVEIVKGAVSTLPIKLYKREEDGDVHEILDDPRLTLLNGDSGDTLTTPEILSAMVEDYYCSNAGAGYMFVDRVGNEVRSLRYVKSEAVTPLEDKYYDPIFKHVAYLVQGRRYESWQFVRILRSTRDGRFGRSIIAANNDALAVAYQTMQFERSLVARGGNKRGFLQSAKKLGESMLKRLKEAWKKFYSSISTGVVILNDGVTFTEASATSTEMQLNENKQTNTDEIYGMFKIPKEIIQCGSTSNASRDARDNFAQFCLMSILVQLRASMDETLLLEEEKPSMFFDFDLSELTKATLKERWEAWAIAKDHGIMQPDEIRVKENLPKLGMDYVTMNLRDVLYDPEEHLIVVPNSGRVLDIDDIKDNPASSDTGPKLAGEGGDPNADTDPR